MLINKVLLKMAKHIKSELTILTMLILLSAIASILQAFSISSMINSIALGSGSFVYYLIAFLLFAFIQIFLKYPINHFTMKNEAKIKLALRDMLYNHLYKLGLAYLDNERTGKISVIILDRIEALGPYYSTYIPNLINVACVSIGCILYIASINVLVAVMALIGVFGILITPSVTYKYLWSTGVDVWTQYEELANEFLDNLQGMETLKNLKACELRKKKMETLSIQMHKKTMDNMKITTIENFLFEIFAGLGSIFSIAYSAYLAVNGRLDIQSVVLILFLIRSCFLPVYNVMNAWHLGYLGLTAADSIHKFMSETPSHWRQPFVAKTNTGISISNLNFAYPNGPNVLHNINLSLAKGKTHAFVGKSGSGKSTLVNLLAGLYAYRDGKIEIDGLPISESTFNTLRAKVAAVWQNPYIFSVSLKENLLYAKPDASDEELDEAIRISNLEDLVNRLENGINTYLGENAEMLSGGEKQRVALARCFLKDAPLLIFDEATSSLDEKNQADIQQSMEYILQGKTAIIIAHRLSTIKNADYCHVMQDGNIIASDSYTQLLQNCELFKNMVNLQEEASYAE